VYPPALLENVGERLAAHPELDGLAGRTVRRDGTSSPSWRRDASILTDENLWNRAASGTTFLRTNIVHEVGEFDLELGRGAGTRWSSGEETEYLVRAVRAGFRIEYDPDLIVFHDDPTPDARDASGVGYRDGASLGYILRKHRYPPRVLARMLVRPVGGAAAALVHRDLAQARFHAATLRGRLAGYRGARPT
jgi:hypothetical protein